MPAPFRPARSRAGWGLAVLLASLLFSFDQSSGEMPFYRDRLYYFLPQYDLCRAALASGEVPLWNSYLNCGQPLLASWQVALGSPLSLPFLIWPFPAAIKVFWVLALGLAGAGMYALGLRSGLNPPAAALAAIVYCGGGPLRSLGEWPNIVAGLALLPALLAVLTDLARGRAGAFAAAGLLAGLIVLAGQPRQVLISGLAAAGWLAACGPLKRSVWIKLAGVSALAAGAAAFQLLSSAELAAFSERRLHGIDPGTALESFLAPADLLTVVAARFWGDETSLFGPGRMLQPRLYLGLAVCWLAIAGLAGSSRPRLFAFLTVPIGLLIALWEPFSGFLLETAGASGRLRYMGHWVLAGFPALCLLAGAGAQRLGERRMPGRPAFWLLVAAGTGVILLSPLAPPLLTFAGVPSGILAAGHLDVIRAGFVVTALVLLLAWACVRFKFYPAVALPLLLGAEFLVAMHGHEAKAPAEAFGPAPAFERVTGFGRVFSPVWPEAAHHAYPDRPEGPRPVAERYAVRASLLPPNLPQTLRIRNAAGYEPFGLAIARDLFSGYRDSLAEVLPALKLAGVRWVVAPDTRPAAGLPREARLLNGWHLLRLPGSLPRVRVLSPSAKSLPWRRLGPLPSLGRARIEEESGNRLRVSCRASETCLLVPSVSWMPGWRFEAVSRDRGRDGRAGGAVRAGGVFPAVPLEAGSWLVTLSYAPFPFAFGLLLASTTLSAVLFLGLAALLPGHLRSALTGGDNERRSRTRT